MCTHGLGEHSVHGGSGGSNAAFSGVAKSLSPQKKDPFQFSKSGPFHVLKILLLLLFLPC